MTFVLKLWNAQWLNAFGVILSILGVLYTGCSYLDKKFLLIKTITHGLAIGIVVAIFFTFSSLVSVFTGYLINMLLVFVLHDTILLPPPDFSENFSIMIPGGLIMGAILGISYCLQREKREKKQMLYRILCNGVKRVDVKASLDLTSGLFYHVPLHKIRYGIQKEEKEKGKKFVFAEHLFLIGGIGFVLMLASSIGIVAWTLSPAVFLPHQDMYSILLFSAGNIGGCLFGVVIVTARKSPWENVKICLIVFAFLFLLFLLFTLLGNPLFETVLEGILHNSQLGMIIGVSISKKVPDKVQTDLKRGARENFIFWLVLGGIAVPFICLLIFNINNTNSPFLFFILHYFLLLGIVNSQGDQILKRIELKAHMKEEKTYDAISWKRFVVGLLIGMLYVFPAVLFLLVTDVLLGKLSGTIIYDLSQNINFSLLVGLSIGFIYGFGPYIISRIENLEERQLGQLGIIITELGLIIAILPH